MNPCWHFVNGIPQVGPLTIGPSAVTSSVPLLAPDGSASAPSYSFASDPDTGRLRAFANSYSESFGGSIRQYADASNFSLGSGVIFGFSDNANPNAGSVDVSLSRGAADVLTTPDRFISTGPVAGIGYGTGAGGTVTQGSGSGKATGATLNTITGQITMDAAALNAATIVSFTFTNSALFSGDMVVIAHTSGGTVGAYTVTSSSASTGSCTIYVRNNTAGALSEALVLKYVVIKAATS